MTGIYKITSPTGRIYIGQSSDIKRRFEEYKKLNNCKSQPKLYNSFLKHGVESHYFEIIVTCKIHELNTFERYYQDLHFVTGKSGLNCVLQCTRVLKKEVSEETKIKLRASRKNQVKTKENLIRMSKSMIGKNSGSKNGMFGKTTPESVKDLQRLKLSGELNYLSKLILNTETGIFYFGLREASDSVPMKKATLHVNITKNKINATSFIYV